MVTQLCSYIAYVQIDIYANVAHKRIFILCVGSVRVFCVLCIWLPNVGNETARTRDICKFRMKWKPYERYLAENEMQMNRSNFVYACVCQPSLSQLDYTRNGFCEKGRIRRNFDEGSI